MLGCREEEVGRRDGDAGSTAMKMTMGHDEFRGEPVTTEITGALCMVHANGEILVHFKVEMGWIHPVIIADRADLLTPADPLSFPDKNPVEVS